MISSEFAIDLARLAKAATTLRTLAPFAPAISVRMFSAEHEATFRVDVMSLSSSFCLHVFADHDPIGLTQGTVERGEDLLHDIAVLIEQAEEAFVARKHQDALIELIAECDPDPDELLEFCERAGIETGTGALSVEDCGTLSSWLRVEEVRAKAAAKPSTVIDLSSRLRAE